MNRMKEYYKYRSLSSVESFRFFLDIILNNRLYAANFKDLNDPMEGIFQSYNDKNIINYVKGEKNKWKICSITDSFKNTLLWSYYADGHNGCCIKFEVVEEEKFKPEKITYIKNIDDIKKEDLSPQTAKRLLLKKSKLWELENEFRILSEEQYIPIRITKILFGVKVESSTFNFYKKLIKKIDNQIQIKQLTWNDIDGGFSS